MQKKNTPKNNNKKIKKQQQNQQTNKETNNNIVRYWYFRWPIILDSDYNISRVIDDYDTTKVFRWVALVFLVLTFIILLPPLFGISGLWSKRHWLLTTVSLSIWTCSHIIWLINFFTVLIYLNRFNCIIYRFFCAGISLLDYESIHQ